MERNSSLNGRLSLSTSSINGPLAESTQINGSSLQGKFPWGGKVSPHKKITPNGSLLQKTIPKVVTSPVRKIDPRIYTDVQSKGLTSRIVKYHETSSKLNRSVSVGNLYNKPGQFPVIHLKRNEIAYKPRRNQSISMVRIAPPEKSVFHTNTRSSILRTGSMVPTIVQGRPDERNLRDNRPILPPAENDLNPTRSVLDALKEISRKRINSDDVDCNDGIKKYCKESEEVLRRNVHEPLQNVTAAHVSVITKRQRELPSPTESKPSSPDSSNAIKKRMCTKNNDISSSLSSSLLFVTPKRKLQDIQSRPPISERRSLSCTSLAPPLAKQQCNENNYVPYPDCETAAHARDQLTSIPPIPIVDPIIALRGATVLPDKPKPEIQQAPQKPKLTLFNKDYGSAAINLPSTNANETPEEEGIAGISFVKPKNKSPTLCGKNALIERVQSSKLSLMLSCLSGELNDSDDEIDAKLMPVTPKEAAIPSVDLTKPPIVPVEPSHLTSLAAPTVSETAKCANISAVPVSSVASTSLPATTISTATDSTAGFSFGLKPAEPIGFGVPVVGKLSAASTNATESQKAPSFTLGNQPKPITTESIVPSVVTSAPAPTYNFAAPVSKTTASAATSASSVPAFAKSAFAVTSTVTAPTSFGTSIPSFGAPVTSTQSASTPATFSFGAPKPAATSSPTSSLSFNTPAPQPIIGTSAAVNQTTSSFSFGTSTSSPAPIMSSTSQSVNSAFGASLATSSKPPMFGSNSFGTIATTQASTQQQPLPAFGSGFGSGGFNASPVVKSPPKFGETASTFGSIAAAGNFNFGATQQQQIKPSAVATGMFGNIDSATTTTASNVFGFGQPEKTTSAPSFSFSGSPSSSSNPSPAFGAAALNQQQSAFAFSTPAPSSAPAKPLATPALPFTFGGAVTQPTPQTNLPTLNFGASADNKPPAFAFGNNTSATSNPVQQTQKPFAFAGSTGESAFTAVNNKPAAPSSGGFVFNSASSAPAENKSIFGSSPAAPQQAPTKSFSFSGQSIVGADQKVPGSIFGAAVTNNNNAAPPAFGAPATTPGKLFSFGAVPVNTVASHSTPNLFGNSSVTSPVAPLFPAAANITPSPFGTTTNNNNKSAGQIFNFGNNNTAAMQQPTNNSSGPFSFDAVAKSDANKPFAFGASAATAAPSATQGNIFGSVATAVKPPAFNFLGGTSGDANSNNSVNNLFNPPGTGTLDTGRREIRTATRRLKPK